MVAVIDYATWPKKDKFGNTSKYIVVRENQKCIVIHNIKKNIFIKIYKEPIKLENSKFLINLLTDFKFQNKYARFLIDVLIIHDEEKNKLIKGYTMHGGKTLTTATLKKYLYINKEIWKRDMRKYSFYYNDFKPDNLIMLDNYISLIDLDAIRQIRPHSPTKVKKYSASKRKIELFDLGWYYSELVNIQLEKFNNQKAEIGNADVE